MGPRGARALATVLLVVVALVDAVSVSAGLDGSAKTGGLLAAVVADTAAAATVGWLVARRHPGNAVGWLLLTQALLTALVLRDGGAPTTTAGAVTAQAAQGSWVLLYVGVALVAYLFPDGRFLSARWRRFVVVCLTGYVAFLVGAAFDRSGFRAQYPGVEPPLPHLPELLADAVGSVGLVLVAASLVGSFVAARQRLRRADSEERLQLLWLTESALAVPAALLTCWLDYWLTGGAGALTLAAVVVMGTVVPVGIGVGILRHRLFDIELVLSRTLTYGVLTVVVLGVYAAVLGATGRVVGHQGGAGLLAVGVVAVALQPLHARVRRRVERAVYGDRSDPLTALRRLSSRLDEVADPRAVVDTVTTCVAEALRVPAARVLVDDDGTSPGVRVPLVHRGEPVGALVVNPPSARPLSDADRRMLDDLAAAAAPVVHTVHLTLELQRSRERLVAAQAEERLRLRRDLHDGLGPALAALVLKLGATTQHVREPAAQVLLRELKEEMRAAIAEVRRVVEGLRPPALDEVGLVASLRQRADALSRDGRLVVTVDGPASVLALPPAVEVAAYRIATEAMTNVVRHASADRCTVVLTANGALQVCVSDNGTGPADDAVPGVGWTSMRERAAELGGSCTVSGRPEGGTTVRAVLPLPAHDRQPA